MKKSSTQRTLSPDQLARAQGGIAVVGPIIAFPPIGTLIGVPLDPRVLVPRTP